LQTNYKKLPLVYYFTDILVLTIILLLSFENSSSSNPSLYLSFLDNFKKFRKISLSLPLLDSYFLSEGAIEESKFRLSSLI
jgi:hypothetical protein